MRQLRQAGLAKVGGFSQQFPNNSTWTERIQSPTFHYEAIKGLVMKSAWQGHEELHRRGKRSKTKHRVCSVITPQLEQNAKSKQEMYQKVK